MTRDRKTVLLLGDILALALSFVGMVVLRFRANASEELIGPQARVFTYLFLLWLLIFFVFDLYNLRRVNPNPRNIGLLALATATSTLLSVLLFYLFPPEGITPKTNLVIVAALSFFFLIGWRRLFYFLFASRYRQRIAIIGSGPAVDHLRADFAAHPHLGTVVYEAPTYQSVDALPPVNLAILDSGDLSLLIKFREATGAQVLSLLGAYEELFAKIPLVLMNDARAIDILTRSQQSAYRFIERALECLIALFVLIITSPFLLVAMLAIAIHDGAPVFYKQARVGKGGVPFFMYKLRSMKKNAEADGARWADKSDPRVTAVGRMLRKTHLDEVPQMINILRGDIALIGPRPERPEFVARLEKEIPYYFLRHTVKPGFTGWAQIKFRYARSELDSQEKFEYDLYWLANRGPLLNLGILTKTAQIIFTHY